MAMDPNGNFALAWDVRVKPDPDDPATWHYDVYAQRFDDGGTPRCDPFVVNTTLAGDQHAPSVAANADGQFVFAWGLWVTPDPDPDTWDWDVYARRYTVTPEPGVTVTPTSGLVTSEDGGAAEFTVVLDSEPAAQVSIGISCSNTSEGTVSSSSLAFDSTTWATPQTVTVSGVDDNGEVDGDVPYTILLAPATSADPNYEGLDPADVSVTNLDNDGAQPECSLAIDNVSQKEGDSGPTIFTFTVTRSGDTSGTVTVGFATADATATQADNDYLPNGDTLTFNPNDTFQTIDVVVVGDQTKEPHETFLVGLLNPTGGATITDAQGIGTIRNDDHQ